MMWKRIILWIVTLLWACCIFCLSAQPAAKSAEVSSKVAIKIARSISGDNASESEVKSFAKKIHNDVRKVAHFGLYLVLGVLLIGLCRSYGVRSARSFLMALGVAVLYAAGDELHQVFVPGRSGQITDILLDSIGAFVGIFLVIVCERIWKAIVIRKS